MPMSPRLLRPRAAGGFDPRAIAGVTLWMDAGDSSTYTESSGQISQWRDKSGLGKTYDQSTANNRPTLFTSSGNVQTATAATINGKQAFYFDGVNDELIGSSNTLSQLTGALGITIFGVVEFDNAATNNRFYGENNTGGTSRLEFGTTTTQWTLFGRTGASGNAVSGGSPSSSVPYVASWNIDLQAPSLPLVTMNANGVQQYSASWNQTTGAFPLTAVSTLIGRRSTSYFIGKLGALLIYTRSLTASEVQTIERGLARQWGITL